MRRGDYVDLELPGATLQMRVEHAGDAVLLSCRCCDGEGTVALVRGGSVEVRSPVGEMSFREPDFAVRRTHAGFAEALEGGA